MARGMAVARAIASALDLGAARRKDVPLYVTWGVTPVAAVLRARTTPASS